MSSEQSAVDKLSDRSAWLRKLYDSVIVENADATSDLLVTDLALAVSNVVDEHGLKTTQTELHRALQAAESMLVGPDDEHQVAFQFVDQLVSYVTGKDDQPLAERHEFVAGLGDNCKQVARWSLENSGQLETYAEDIAPKVETGLGLL